MFWLFFIETIQKLNCDQAVESLNPLKGNSSDLN